MRRPRRFDVIFLGGGLANGLAAYRLAMANPPCKMLLIEEQPQIGGHHTWCFHESDLVGLSSPWPLALADQSWEGYDVFFPNRQRRLNSKYYTLRSQSFHKKVADILGDRCMLGTKVTQIYEDQVYLSSGDVMSGATIVDGRGLSKSTIPQGYQKFLGRYLRLDAPHGLDRPLLMDARVEQLDGFRFIYLLPVSPTELLVEDTYYSDTSELDEDTLRSRIDAYIANRNWRVVEVLDEETGVLPLPLWSKRQGATGKTSEQALISRFEHASVIPSGMRASLFHPTTGYSFPAAVRFADALASCGDLTSPKTRAFLLKHIDDHRRAGLFYRRLNNMMFLGATPGQRRRVMEKFYGRGEGLIQRFYAHRSTLTDKIRMLSGIPPIPARRGIKTFFNQVEADA